MKVSELFEAKLSGAAKAAFNLGKTAGKAGKPGLSKATVAKSFGVDGWGPYSDGYREGKDEAKNKDDADAWHEKTAAKRQGRHYHE